MNSKSFFALHWIAGNIILPEHIWRNIVTNGDPTTFAPDPQIIGCGPFKAYPHSVDLTAGDYYVPQQYVKLDSYHNYFRYTPDYEYPCWDQLNTMPEYGFYVYKLNYAPLSVHFEKHVVVLIGTNYYWFDFGPDGQAYTADDGGWVLGNAPTALPNPNNPAGVEPWIDDKPPATYPGNVPGVLAKPIPLPPGQAIAFFGIERCGYTMSPGIFDYGWKVETSLNPEPWRCVPGDINGDGYVNVLDAISLSFHFGLKAYVWFECDINVDKKIDTLDALVLIDKWGI